MRKWLCSVSLGLLSAATLVAQGRGGAPPAPAPPAPTRAQAFATAPDIPYEAVPNFLKLPANLYLGEGIGVATDSKGNIFVYTRSGETRLFEFDKAGNYLREIGQGIYAFEMAHGVRVDAQDNIWAVDEGTNVVLKFDPQGRFGLILNRREEASLGLIADPAPGTPPRPPQPYYFARPTDIAFDAAGNVFVADGYTNSRVAKYAKNGRFIKSVGSAGNGVGQFNTPHSIQTDALGNVYVADRGNRRIQVFDNDLIYRASYENVGAPWALCITPGPHQYLYSSNSNPDNNDSRLAAVSGEIYKMELDGTVVGKFGKPGKLWGEFGTVHAIDCRNENELLVAEITNWRVQKIILRPASRPPSSR